MAMRETTHNPKDDHGEEVKPYKVIPPNAGWLICPQHAGQYTGDNQPWRK